MRRSLSTVRSAAALSILLFAANARAIDLDLEPPPPTLFGGETQFSVEPIDVVGTAEVRWDFGDGTSTEYSTTDTTITHSYAAPGHYTVIVLARDDAGFMSRQFQHTVHTSPTPQQPQSSTSIVLDSERGLVITANADNGTVTLVDSTTLEKVAEIPVFSNPVALAFAPDGFLWVVHKEDYAVALVDLEARRTVDFFRLPYASQPEGIVFSPSGDAYVPLGALGEVARIDGTTHEIVARRAIAPFVRGITISGDGASLWVTRFLSPAGRGEVYRLSSETLDTVARYDLTEDTTTVDSDVQGRGLPNYLFSVAVTPDGTRAWVPSKKDNMSRGLERDGLALTQDTAVRPMVSILDLAANQEVLAERIDLDDRNLPQQITFTPLGDWAFVSVFGSNLVELRDAFDRSFITALRAESLFGPVGSVLAPDDRLVVFADLARKLIVFDVADLVAGVDNTTKLVTEVPLVENEKLPAEVLRGKQVFANAEDKRMTTEGYLSCSSCHFDGFEDGLVWDFFDRGEGFRNTTSLLGRRGMGQGRVHWSANFDEIQDFDNPIRAHQGGLGFIALEEFETGTRNQPLGDPKAGLDPDLDALAAYVTSLGSIPRSPFRSADGTLTVQAVAGQQHFVTLGCGTCHSGDDFTDSAAGELHDVGTLTELSGSRLGGELTGIDTPTLLGIWQTAPYLHDGSAATLRDVLTTRNPDGAHGDTSSLSEEQLDELVAYLMQIDHGLPPVELTLPTEPPPGGAGGEGGGAGATLAGAGGEAGASDGGTSAGGGAPTAGVSGSGAGASGASGAAATGGTAATGGGLAGGGGSESEVPEQSTGCGCEVAAKSSPRGFLWLAAGLLALVRRRGRVK
jgi:MYXO-CTERM domain-containing protein